VPGEPRTVGTLRPLLGGSPGRGPVVDGPAPASRPRVARHQFELRDGHRVSVAVAGRGVPLVVVHGYSAEGFMYVQTLSRLVASGFKVVAIDTAGHGGTEILPQGQWDIERYTELLGRAVDELGIRSAVLAGHSMGGRLVAQLGAARPHRTIGVLLLDAIVGRPWDRMVALCRVAPPLLVALGAAMAVDTVGTVPITENIPQVAKLGKLGLPWIGQRVRRPWGIVPPGVAILRATPSRPLLERLRDNDVPVIAIHGERDLIVPLAAARDAAELAQGELVVVRGGSHSWLLRDPETLPAIVTELLRGRLGAARARALGEHGLRADAPVDAVEDALYEPNAPILDLTPPTGPFVARRARRPHYRWTRWTPVEYTA